MRRGATPWMLLSLALCGLTGCGYSSDKLFRSGISTVHVEVFQSKEFRRGMEFQLTEAVKKRIGTDTPYRIAPREKADTILKGEILEERQASFAPDYATRQPRDMQLNLVCRVEWKDVRSGQILLDQPLLLSSTDYLPAAGETEGFGQQKAISDLAAKIVMRMTDDW
ncbi:MAG: hypothetical protein HZB38_12300 [Planctomycetes bacterium]|nr:hypothetical protein [Planctomycetota bacterium]